MPYIATRDFKSSKHGQFREGKQVDVPTDAIVAWKKSGLIREDKEPERPLVPAGRKSSASRPARASRQTIAIESEPGETQAGDEALSSSTSASDLPDGLTSSTPPTLHGGDSTT